VHDAPVRVRFIRDSSVNHPRIQTKKISKFNDSQRAQSSQPIKRTHLYDSSADLKSST
jgi:hypothetical protein